MNDIFFLEEDNVIEMSSIQERENARDEEAYREFRALLSANEKLYRNKRTYCISMRYINAEAKEYYNQIKNKLMSYTDCFDASTRVHYELEEDAETFYLGHVIARFRVEGNILCFYIRLDPTKYQTNDAIHKDVSSIPRFAETPMKLKINKQTRATKSLGLIQDLMEQVKCIPDHDYIDLDYASFFTRNALYIKRATKVSEKEDVEEIIEQTVAVIDIDEIAPDDVISLSPTFKDDFDYEVEKTSSKLISEVSEEPEPKIEEPMAEEPESEPEKDVVMDDVLEEETLKEEALEEEALEEEVPEEDGPAYVYENNSSPEERPVFREIHGIKRITIDEESQEKRDSIFDTPQETETKKMKKLSLWQELASYGYNFVLFKQLQFYLIGLIAAVVLGIVYKLKWPFILVLVAVVLLSIPKILTSYYRNKYEERKYKDVTSYIEQMLYSFQRNSKILVSLNDALVVFPSGYMHDKILEAIEHIRYSRADGNVYAAALKIIEDAYPCRRVKSLHRYMIKVENVGGKHDAGVKALLKDRRQWIDRTAAFRKQCSTTIREIIISTIFSLIMAGVILYMMPSDLYDLSSSIVYQIATTIFVVVNFIVIRITLSSTVVYLKDDDEEQAKKTVKLIDWLRSYDPKKETKKYIKQSIIFLVLAVVGIVVQNAIIAIIGVLLALFTIFIKKHLDYNSAQKRARREIEKSYPDWLLELALLLQTDNAHVAISKTIDSAPLVLRKDLHKLTNDLRAHPNDLAPYIAFFDFIPTEGIQSSMRLLYSIAVFGAVDESVQIAELVERNHTLMEHAERLKNEDKLSLVFSIKFIPMLSSSVKMLVDLMLFLFSYLAIIGTVM